MVRWGNNKDVSCSYKSMGKLNKSAFTSPRCTLEETLNHSRISPISAAPEQFLVLNS